MKKKYIINSLVLLGFVPLAIWCYRYINYDLWYDEVYSLEHFSLTDLYTTLFYYPAPNNHIFFNLTSQIISRVFGLRDILLVEEHTYIFRAFQLLIALLTAYYCVRIVKRFFKGGSSFLLYVILFTTIPFMNFSLQLRGYNMSSLFLVMLLYYTWAYVASRKKRHLFIIAVFSALIIYTIPSNLYVLLALWGVVLISWFYYRRERDLQYKNYWAVLICISIGATAAFLLYLPILRDVVFNSYTSSGASGFFQSAVLLLRAVPAFLSARYLLLILVPFGLLVLYRKTDFTEIFKFLSLLILFFSPYVISFIHHRDPFPRVFIALAPIFCIILTILIIKFSEFYLSNKQKLAFQFLMSIYCVAVFIYEINRNDNFIEQEMVDRNTETQNLYRNFYLADFYRQDRTMKQLSEIYQGAPVVKFEQRDPPSTNLYLKKYHIPYTEVETAHGLSQKLVENERLFILTSYKKNTLRFLQNIKGVEATALTPEYSYTNIILVETQKE